jgi:hypothetical protein
MLPASGIAFIGGQSGAGKTFVAVALGVALAAGTKFFEQQVKERVGVVYVAAEGAPMFAARVEAAKLAAGVKGLLPFAWVDKVPALQKPDEVAAFINELRALEKEMQRRFDVRLGAIFIDTVAACFPMKDENANAEVSGVCRTMRQVGESVGALVVPMHHYGKDAGTGLRGASAWRGAADVVVSVTCDIDALSGDVRNRGLAIAKARDAEQGPIAPFILEWVKLGVDEDGEDFGTMIVKPDPERKLQDLRRGTSDKGAQAFESACRTALEEGSEDVQLRAGGSKVRAVDLDKIRARFFETYVTGAGDGKQQHAATKRAWSRILNIKSRANTPLGKGRIVANGCGSKPRPLAETK